MALTQLSQADLVSPVNNPVMIVYTSDNRTEDDFRYEYTITNGSTNVDLISVKVWPDPSESDKGIYDLNMVLKDSVSITKTWDTYFSSTSVLSLLKYDYTITEYIGTLSGETTTVEDRFVFQGAVSYDESFDYTDYLTNSGNTGLLLSRWSGPRTYSLNDWGIINVFNTDFVSVGQSWGRILIKVFHISGGSTTYYIQNKIAGVPISGHKIQSIPLGPKNLNLSVSNSLVKSYPAGSVISSDIIDTDTDYYEVWVADDLAQFSEKLKVDVDHECLKYDGTLFMWLGKLSNLETFRFKFANMKSFNISREEIKKGYYDLDGSNNWTFDKGDRGRQTTSLNVQQIHTAISGWLTDLESSNLMELYFSTDAYIIKNDEILPIVVESGNVVERTSQNDRLFNLTINYTMAYDINQNL